MSTHTCPICITSTGIERPNEDGGYIALPPAAWRAQVREGCGAPCGTLVLRSEIAIELLFRRRKRPARSFLACSLPTPGLRASTRCGRQLAHHGRQERLGRQS